MHFLMQGISEFVVYLNSSSRDISSGRSLVHWHNLEYHWRTILHCCLVHCIIFREGLTFGYLGRGSDAFSWNRGTNSVLWRTMLNIFLMQGISVVSRVVHNYIVCSELDVDMTTV